MDWANSSREGLPSQNYFYITLFCFYASVFSRFSVDCSVERVRLSLVHSSLLGLWITCLWERYGRLSVSFSSSGCLITVYSYSLFDWLVRGFYWSVICCCSSVGTIICNTLSVYVHGDPSKLYYVCSIIVFAMAICTYFMYPSEKTNHNVKNCIEYGYMTL